MKILIAEDDPMYCQMLETMLLKWGYEVIICSNGSDAWEILQSKDAPQFAILDWLMPRMDGVEICKKIRENIKEPYVYILLLTSKDEKKDIIEGMDSGADDYITKPFHANELRVRLRAGRRILELQEELLSSRETMRLVAMHDALTGLLNRGAIMGELERRLSQAVREKSHLGVLLIDIDHFKKINDTFGHMAGDAVICETARRLKSSARPYDQIGRYGGEEFLIVLPGCDLEDAVKHAERLRISIEENQVDTSEGVIPVTMSLGVTANIDGNLTEIDSLIRAADNALYKAKNNGRNRVESVI